MPFKILPYDMNSESAKAIAHRLNASRIKRDNSSRYNWKEGDVIINWGCPAVPPRLVDVDKKHWWNHPSAVDLACNKLICFNILKENRINIPEFTTDINEAHSWIDNGDEVVCRKVLRGHSGEGIVIAATHEEVVDAPLYTKYFKKKTEFRIHCSPLGETYIQRKMRKREVANEKVNWKIRNLDGGFIYGRENLPNIPDYVKQMCNDTREALGLDLCAIDVMWNQKKDEYKILEVNTAPGISGATVDYYIHILMNGKKKRKVEDIFGFDIMDFVRKIADA